MTTEDCFYVGAACANEYDDDKNYAEEAGFPARLTRWVPIVTDEGCPGYMIERNGRTRYVLLNLSSNEPTVWVYSGEADTTPGEGDCQPLHFYDLRGDFE